MNSDNHNDVPAASAGDRVSGLAAADEAFRVLNAGTARLVQLLADELVPLAPATLDELQRTTWQVQAALPHLAQWAEPSPSASDWVLEPPFKRVAVRLTHPDHAADVENVERLRRSFDLLDPHSLALRKEAAIIVVDALLDQLRCQDRRPSRSITVESGTAF